MTKYKPSQFDGRPVLTREWLLARTATFEDSTTRALDDSIRAAELESQKNQRILRIAEITLTHSILIIGLIGIGAIFLRH